MSPTISSASLGLLGIVWNIKGVPGRVYANARSQSNPVTVRERIGIIGSGIAGMGAAWQLRHQAEITLIERDTRPGGQTNTVVVEEDGEGIPIDTGFIVFNHVTYPNLVRLFQELGVERSLRKCRSASSTCHPA
jgi:predicted NAD/FAD-binding protein